MTEISESLNELKNCINSYSGLPTGVSCRIGDTQGRAKGIGIKIQSISTRQNVCGGANSVVLVEINYQEPAQTDNDKLGVIDMMSGLMNWIEKTIENASIARMPMMSSRAQSGIDLYTMQVRMFC